ncbi:alpha/beta hydrolase domain-containing protein VTE7-like isoform X6 [Primulina eburnea]|uniref:alpha/beta hydrolase domain-containing protein VTE7-like isoform X6 n=1 Tax=Primulina eburnea TaxID=1245227 RepID=UPI003C6CB3CD
MLVASPSGASAIMGKEFPSKFTHYGLRRKHNFRVWACEFPAFLPKEVENIKDQFARNLASRIDRLPVPLSLTKNHIMSSCVKPKTLSKTSPLVLLHGFDRSGSISSVWPFQDIDDIFFVSTVYHFLLLSSLLEWRYVLPLLEEAGLETWAFDILGWGFSDLENLPPCNVASKRDHLYQFWNSYIRRPVTLVGPSLGAAVAIDFVVNYPQAVNVDKLIFIDASVYAEGTGNLAKLPKLMAYAGVYLLKSIPLRLYATSLAFNRLSWNTCVDWTNVKQKALVIWGENDQIIDSKLSVRLQCELPNAIIRQVPDCGHIPHVEKPAAVSKLITDFVQVDGQVDIPAGLTCLKKV